ncbi:MAG: hypothetical protein R6U96_14595, partial [Promethearchaeia archaeon]
KEVKKMSNILIKDGNELNGQFFCNGCGEVHFGENLKVLILGDSKNYLCKKCYSKLEDLIIDNSPYQCESVKSEDPNKISALFCEGED